MQRRRRVWAPESTTRYDRPLRPGQVSGRKNARLIPMRGATSIALIFEGFTGVQKEGVSNGGS